MDRPAHLPQPPAPERYRVALRSLELRKRLSIKDERMLIEHCAAPDHTVTATELAALVGYPDGNTINLRYGLLAGIIADTLRWPVPDGHQESYAVAWFEKPGEDRAHWRWHMHPELVQAVRALGWDTRARRRRSTAPIGA